jgi:hypothetical protein
LNARDQTLLGRVWTGAGLFIVPGSHTNVSADKWLHDQDTMDLGIGGIYGTDNYAVAYSMNATISRRHRREMLAAAF